MKKPALVLIVACFFFAIRDGAALHDSTNIVSANKLVPMAESYRTFEGLAHLPTLTRLDPIIATTDPVADSVSDKRAYAHNLLQKVLNDQRFLESLDALSEIDLPIGIVKSGDMLDYTILIDRIRFTKEGARMDAYVSLALPQTGTRLAFHGVVPLFPRGGVGGNARVFLLGDHAVRLDHNTLVTLKGGERSYVEFDCTGFLGVNLDAEIQFSTDLIQPEDKQGNALPERLKIHFTTYTQSLNDMLVQVTIPPFQIRGLKGFGFHVTEAYLDWSDISNPSGLVFPSHYTSSVVSEGLDNLWTGIYMKALEVRLPTAFVRTATEARLSIGAQHMLIDNLGVTGQVYAANLFEDGNMNGWKYSLDRAALQLTTNRVTGFALEGNLTIPVVRSSSGKGAEFRYTAEIGADGNYIFSVAVQDSVKLDLWMADLKLEKGSTVIVAERDKKFFPSAHLNGTLSINITEKGPGMSFNSVRFENMTISSEAPHFRPGTFGFGREGRHSSISKYPVVFDNITFKSDEHRIGLAFDLMINISGNPEDESFAGKAGLVIWGIQDTQPQRDANGKIIGIDRHNWTFDEVALSTVKINIRKPKVIELTGEVRFFDDDRIYGEGFKGKLKGKIHTISVEAEALFGRTEEFRYWYADALMELKTGIPIVPGVLSAFGFGGGYYSRMRQTNDRVDGTLGRSLSGITYIPDANTVGIRAIVLIGTPRPEAMKGDVALEVSLNRHGGINSVTFTGNANFMSAPSLGAKQIRELASAAVAGHLTERLNDLLQGQIYGRVKLHFDNVNDVFHGNLEIFVNVAGGMVRGVSEGNKAGWAVLHFESQNWYIHIGTPDQPIGLEVARIFKARSYVMFGKNLPGSPPPPSQVTEILGNIDLDYMRDLNALESGMGAAFGLHFLVDTGDLQFLMFYGRFSAGTGLDFMLKDYGTGYHCAGSNDPIGINGWYANGQAYAFVMGKIGIRVNLRFYKGSYEILSIGAATVLQAKGPNPFWMKGTVGGHYRILGGLVKGRCRFEVTVGNDCQPVAEENLLEDVALIADITPFNGSSDVSVFNAPQVVFNIPVGEVFQIADMENKTHQFRAVLDEFSLREGTNAIPGSLRWNENRDIVVFDAVDLLPGEKKLTAYAKLSFEEKLNGVWTKVKFENKVVSETKETAFFTGKAPDHIPEENVAFAYPAPNQLNFYPEEYNQGIIELHRGQPNLFATGQEWIQKVRMSEPGSGRFLESDLSYDRTSRRITFSLPAGFQNDTQYRFEIVNVPRTISHINQNVRKVDRELLKDSLAGSAVLTTQSVEGNLDMRESKTIFSTTFRTSKYDTFIEKMQSMNVAPAIRLSAGINIFRLKSRFQGDEFFDELEIGSPGHPGNVRLEAVLSGNSWYELHTYPLVYRDYPFQGWMKVRRQDPEVLGIPPVRDIHIEKNGLLNTGSTLTDTYVVYNLGYSVASDFHDLQHHAVNYVADHGLPVPAAIEALVVNPLPYIRYGYYKVKFSYVIPGIGKTSSSYQLEIFNPIPDND